MLQNLTLGKQVTRALNPVYLPQGLERLVGGGRECSLPGRYPGILSTTSSSTGVVNALNLHPQLTKLRWEHL